MVIPCKIVSLLKAITNLLILFSIQGNILMAYNGQNNTDFTLLGQDFILVIRESIFFNSRFVLDFNNLNLLWDPDVDGAVQIFLRSNRFALSNLIVFLKSIHSEQIYSLQRIDVN